MSNLKILHLFLMLILFSSAFGQKKVLVIPQVNEPLPKDIKVKNQRIDSAFIGEYISGVYDLFHRHGYLSANLDIPAMTGDTLKIGIKPGEKYLLKSLSPGNLSPELLRKTGVNLKHFNSRNFNYSEVQRDLDRILGYSDNHGFPFASVKLDSVELNGNQFTAAVLYDSGPFITFDTISVSGEINTSISYLYKYLRIFPGEPFEYQRITQAPARIDKLLFLEMGKENYLSFQNNEATFHLEVNPKRVNSVDGVIGFFPNEVEDGKLLLTGQFDLQLHNLFASGKQLAFNWKSLKQQSQSLRMHYFHPILFGSMINAELNFNLLKEDTTFLNRNIDVQVSMDVAKNSLFKLLVNNKVSNVLTGKPLQESDLVDFDLTSYGLGYEFSRLNRFIDPTRGIDFDLNAQIGNKKLRETDNLPDDFLDPEDLETVQYQINASVRQFYPLGRRWVLNWETGFGKIINQKLFLNDLFRLGGLNSIRGFNENFFFASMYALSRLDMKFYFESNSNFSLFYDQMWLENKAGEGNSRDSPSGIGAGINFQTDAGVFSFVYALGRTKNQTFNFNLSRIHFGYTSRF